MEEERLKYNNQNPIIGMRRENRLHIPIQFKKLISAEMWLLIVKRIIEENNKKPDLIGDWTRAGTKLNCLRLEKGSEN